MSVRFERNDITRVKADVIVNTANPMPTYAGGTDAAIYRAAGETELLVARKKIGRIDPGNVEFTPAFNLSAKYIFHAVGPKWIDGTHEEFDILKSCYEKSLALAIELKCKSIAFPLIATGVYGFPRDKALQIAMSTIEAFLMKNDIDVIMVVFDKASFELTGKVVDKVREYVDSNYVEEAHIREFDIDVELEEEEYMFIRRRNQRRINRYTDSDTASLDLESTEKLVTTSTKVNLDKMLENNEKTFQQRLFEIIDERKLTGPQVYKNYITKQVYSKIQSDVYYSPSKPTAIALCLSLHLSIEETLDLINRAGWTLSPSNKADIIIKGCIINKVYKLMDINSILFDYGCDEFDKLK